ncbi:MAG: insulinase family protein [Gemmatimonadetes bacterium]|nr:insulinase family protein [Gemmatimonadota bacterium]
MTPIHPTPGIPGPYEFPVTSTFTLSNGLQVIVAPMPRLPLVTAIAVIDAGAAIDPAGGEGLATLSAAALAEGTVERDGPTLADAFERLGTSIECGADWDEATAQFTVTPSRFSGALALLAEVLQAPRFDSADIERLKAERLADLLQQRVEPRGLADERFARAVYDARSRYARPAGGTPTTVRTLEASRVRDWHARGYGAQSTTLIVAGDITAKEVHAEVELRFGGWTSRAPDAPAVDASSRTTAREVHIVAKPDAPQSELRVGHVGLPRAHPDYFAVVVMNAVLGGLFSSRINLNLRERHAYTYGAYSAFDWRRAAGPFVVGTAVKTEVTDAAVREILSEIDQIRAHSIRSEELDLATSYLAGVFPIRYETTNAVASALALATVYGLPADYFSTYRQRIGSVTQDDVLRVARAQLQPDALQVLAVGNADAIAAPLAGLGIGTPTVTTAADDS